MADKSQREVSDSTDSEAALAVVVATEGLVSPGSDSVRREHDQVAEELRILRQELQAWRSATREDVPSLQDIREELQGTLRDELAKAQAEADEAAKQVEERCRSVDEQVQALLGSSTALIDSQLSGAAKALREDVERLVQQAKQEHAAIEQKRARTEAVLAALVEISDQQAEFVVQYQPGTIEQLRQRLDYVERERDELRSAKLSAEEQCISAQRELQSYKTQHGLADIKELEDQKAKAKKDLEQLRTDAGNIEQLKLNHQELTREINELRPLRERYESVQRENIDIAQLRAQAAALDAEKWDLDRERRQAEDRATKQLLRADAATRDKTELARQLSLREADIKRLEGELASHRQREQNYQQLCDEVEAERKRLADWEKKREQSLKEQGLELRDKARLLEDMFERRNAELWDKIKLEHQDVLAEATRERDEAQRSFGELKESHEKLKVEHLALQRKDIESGVGIRDRELEVVRLDREIRVRNDELKSLADRLNELRGEEGSLRQEARDAAAEAVGHEGTVKALKAEAEEIRGQIDRLREDRERKEKGSTREARIEAIEQPVPGMCMNGVGGVVAEAEWLAGVRQGIEASGFRFPDRLLKAFHTSLKIADWSSLTVLAGVSGTGKSELPKLYARFGGIEFMPVPVLPNWDSPSDLFGFFDYLSGQFKPTQLLQALARCTRKEDERMLVVMLDEMNLARVELYFSELLSRLEGRRHDGETPSMPVDIGSGMQPYEVSLGSNLLFVGTVNEDESTNTLSDKVLDRSNVIYFPRPRELVTRDQSGLAARAKNGLRPETWKSWQQGNDRLELAVRNQLKSAFDRINDALGLVNRAVAHRILQITERYVANHPDVVGGAVEDAWKSAFEDQLAQKVMPKLRGITVESSDGQRCLDVIGEVLDEYTHTPALKDDYKRARGAGDGQFVWCSSSYLEDRNTGA